MRYWQYIATKVSDTFNQGHVDVVSLDEVDESQQSLGSAYMSCVSTGRLFMGSSAPKSVFVFHSDSQMPLAIRFPEEKILFPVRHIGSHEQYVIWWRPCCFLWFISTKYETDILETMCVHFKFIVGPKFHVYCEFKRIILVAACKAYGISVFAYDK